MTFTWKKMFILSLCAAVATGATIHGASAEGVKKIHVKLVASQEVPPNDSKATGKANFDLETTTKQLTWSIKTTGLSSDAMAAHIHGPAAPGANGDVVINLAPNGMANPLKGSATLTDAQVADLLAGKDYVNVHTKTNPGGEIRGQIVP